MCTLALFWRVFPDAAVTVAANRDENPLRPWRDPHRWDDGSFAGRDETAGGTWLGVGPSGVVAGITNRWGPANDPARRSRGLVVTDALGAATAADAVRALAQRSPSETNAFGLLVADAGAAFRVDCNGLTIAVQPLAPGVTVLANWSADERRPRSERALQLAALVPTVSLDAAWPALRTLVSDHEGAEIPGQPICAHGERYATVCSTLLAAGGSGVRWSDARGNPCTAPWTDRRVEI
jgi:uncharacterized protein with NRDE domain